MKDDMKHRFLMKNSSVVVFIDKNSHVIITKYKFLSYSTDKERFANKLGNYFQERGHSVIYAERVRDRLIAREALKLE